MPKFRDIFTWDEIDDSYPENTMVRLYDVVLLKDLGRYKKGAHFYCVDWYHSHLTLNFFTHSSDEFPPDMVKVLRR